MLINLWVFYFFRHKNNLNIFSQRLKTQITKSHENLIVLYLAKDKKKIVQFLKYLMAMYKNVLLIFQTFWKIIYNAILI